ncbi:MAG: LOG family protein [Bacteroidia bacterium]
MNSQKHERYFLQGPHSRNKEFIFVIRVLSEFIRGFRAFHFLGPCVTVFGSARYKEGHPYYELGRQLGRKFARMGFTVMTGGGPGIMEAVNRGAQEAHGRSVGCNIVLPHEQHPNPYLDKWVNIKFFFVRKVLLSKYSYSFVVLPGGYGTLDEFFEALTLIQTDSMKHFPVVLFGKEYHAKLYEHVKQLAVAGTIGIKDIDLFLLTDSIDEAVAHIDKYAVAQFGLKRVKAVRPLAWLGEKV